MKLVIIESPAKREALKKYLGEGYEVFATKGHIRDLPPKSFAIDIKNNFEPKYEILSEKKELINELKRKADKAEQVYIATDPDREGEAISWHVAHILGYDTERPCRIQFNEISKKAVSKALTEPRKIDLNLVDAQQARRVLDRLVGYKLSPIICKKIAPKLSAGRVQSVALKLVVDREVEIENFIPEEYWTVNAILKKGASEIKAALATYKKKKFVPKNKEEVDNMLGQIKDKDFLVKEVKKAKTKSHAPAPFTTSTMQQDALNKLGMSLAKTSAAAQQLYEGVEVKGEGKIALITYIRTDSVRVSTDAQNACREFIKNKFGADFVPEKPNIYHTKDSAQDAHEAIRPITMDITPEMVKETLTSDNYKLYKLIYERFLASQMSDAEYASVTINFDCEDYGFKVSGKTMEFPGYTNVYKEFVEEENKEGLAGRL
ncbi:MAG: type I DNA topoisomerase, partial [Clostridia bacterium]|nr:type I DNA topoisomerase [Clostridia bacterium]